MACEISFGDMKFTLKNGLNMPAVGMGTLGIRNYDVLYKTIDYALEFGYRLFDTASAHGNERALGNVFRELLPKHGLVREDIFITTKLSPFANDPKLVTKFFEKSLENLNMDYIDMYMIHYPAFSDTDPKSSENAKMRAETWVAITKLYDQSKIKAIGVSNFTIAHLMQMAEVMAVGPMVNQIEWHPYYYKPEMLQYCSDHNIRIQAYCSFGGLSQKNTELIFDPLIRSLARKYNSSASQILLLWSLQRGVAVIPKSTNPDHLKENIELNIRISEKDLAKMDNLSIKNRKYAWDPTSIV